MQDMKTAGTTIIVLTTWSENYTNNYNSNTNNKQ